MTDMSVVILCFSACGSILFFAKPSVITMSNLVARIFWRAVASAQLATDALVVSDRDSIRKAVAALVQAEAALGQLTTATAHRAALAKVRRSLEFALGGGAALSVAVARAHGPLRQALGQLTAAAERAEVEADPQMVAAGKLRALLASGQLIPASRLPQSP